MAIPDFLRRRDSLTRAPNYSAKRETESVLRGDKKTPTEADYKPASNNSKQRCHECKFYTKYGEPESDCGKIIGIVKAEGVCDLWVQRDYSSTTQQPKTEIVIRLGG